MATTTISPVLLRLATIAILRVVTATPVVVVAALQEVEEGTVPGPLPRPQPQVITPQRRGRVVTHLEPPRGPHTVGVQQESTPQTVPLIPEPTAPLPLTLVVEPATSNRLAMEVGHWASTPQITVVTQGLTVHRLIQVAEVTISRLDMPIRLVPDTGLPKLVRGVLDLRPPVGGSPAVDILLGSLRLPPPGISRPLPRGTMELAVELVGGPVLPTLAAGGIDIDHHSLLVNP